MTKTLKVALSSLFAFAVAGMALAASPATTFTKSMTVGSTGAEVKMLQQFLNSCADTALAVTAGAAGSAGYETMTFGPATKAAVAKYQTKYGLSPAVGYFGPLSRAKAAEKGNECGVGPGPVVTGPVSVALSASNPAPTYLAATQARATLLKLTFSGNGTVTSVSLKKKGSAADSTYQNVYLFDGNMRLTDGGSVAGNGTVTFANPSGLFMVNGSKEISVVTDLNGTSGDIVGFDLTSMTVSGGTAQSMMLPGNIHSLTSASGLSTVIAGATTSPSATATIDPQNDFVVWQNTVSVSGTSSGAKLSSLALRKIGSINNADINTFRLQVDGQTVATTANLDGNDIVTLVPASPVDLAVGSRVVRVLANITGGATRTFQFQLRYAVDAGLWDGSTNIGIKICPNSGCSNTFSSLTTGTQTVSGASTSFTFQKATNSPSGDVMYNGNNVSLAKWTVRASSESIKIDQLSIAMTGLTGATGISTGGNTVADVTLRNAYVTANGMQVGSTQGLLGSGTTFNTNYTVQAGQTVELELRADMYDTNSSGGGSGLLPANTAFTMQATAGSSNAQGVSSGTVFNIPAAAVTANQVTVKSGSLTGAVDGTYPAQTTVAPRTMYKMGAYTLTSGSVEDTNVDTLTFTVNNAAVQNINNVMAKIDGVQFGTTRATIGTGAGPVTVAFSGNYTLAKGSSKKVEIYGDLLSSTTGTVVTTMAASGTTTPSGTSVSVSAVTGQTITVGTGTFAMASDTTRSPLNRVTYGPQNDVVVGAFRATASSDEYRVRELVVKFTGTNASTVVGTVYLKDQSGANVGSTLSLSGGSATFSSIDWLVPANSNDRALLVYANLSAVGEFGGSTGARIDATVDSVKYANSAGVETTDGTDIASGREYYAYKSAPKVENVSLPSTVLAAGTQTVARFSVSAMGGNAVVWKKLVLASTVTGSVTLTGTPSIVDSNGTTIPATVTLGGASPSYTITIVLTNEEEILSSKTYSVRATVGGTIANGDSLQTRINNGTSAYAAPAAYATVAATASNFVWSDKAFIAHSASTLDWNNDYLIEKLPTDSQTLYK